MAGRRLCLALSLALLAGAALHGQTRPVGDPKAMVSAAVETELDSNRNDHTAYVYRDRDVTPDRDTVFLVVETPQGSLKKKLADHERPLTADQRRADDERLKTLMGDHGAQEKARKDAIHDDEQAEEFLKLLPTAFLWTFVKSEGDLTTLAFKPDPAFEPKTFEARVLSALGGEIVIARSANRIRTIRGSLLDDVKIGYGILGRLRKGGTFQVERREIVPHHWQVTESKVHLDGHALFFKTIGQQEDEYRSDFKPSPASTLEQALDYLRKTQ